MSWEIVTIKRERNTEIIFHFYVIIFSEVKFR